MGLRDITYNAKRNLFGAVSIDGATAYHLFSVNASGTNRSEIVRLIRRSKWHSRDSNPSK